MKRNRMKLLLIGSLLFSLVACQLPQSPKEEPPAKDETPIVNPTPSDPTPSPVETPSVTDRYEAIAALFEQAKNELVTQFHQKELTTSTYFPAFSSQWVYYEYQSSHPEVLTEDGLVTRPLPNHGNQEVVLTVIMTYGEYQETISITLTVLAYVLENNIYWLHQTHQEKTTLSVEALGIIYAFHDFGFFMTDGTANISVAYPENFLDLELGDLVLVQATYYGRPYLNSTMGRAFHLDWTHPVTVLSKGHSFEHDILSITFEDYHRLDQENPLNIGKAYRIFGRLTDFPYDKINDTTSFLDLHFPYLARIYSTPPPGKAFIHSLLGQYVELVIYYFDYDPHEGFVVTLVNPPYEGVVHDLNPVYTNIEALHYRAFPYEEVTLKGIIVHLSYNGYYIHDGVRQVYVTHPGYQRNVTVQLGDLVQVKGLYQPYYTGYQLTYVSQLDVLESDRNYTLNYTFATHEQLHALLNDEAMYFDQNRTIRMEYGNPYQVIGTIIEKDAFNRLYLKSLDSDLDLWFHPSYHTYESYQALESFLGEDVILNVVYHASDSSQGIVVIFDGNPEDIRLYHRPEDLMQKDIDEALSGPNVAYKTSLNLLTQGSRGSIISWVSSHPEYIGSDGSFVSIPEMDTWVTLTGTVIYNDLIRIIERRVLAKAQPDQVTDLVHLNPGDWAVIEGVVIAHDWHTYGFFIQAANGQGLYIESNSNDYYEVAWQKTVILLGQYAINTESGNYEPMLTNTSIIEIGQDLQTVFVFEMDDVQSLLNLFPNQYAKSYVLYDLVIGFYSTNGTIGVYSKNDPNTMIYFVDWYLPDVNLETYPVGTAIEKLEFIYCRIYHGVHYVIGVQLTFQNSGS